VTATATVSVVINTLNRADVLERALESLDWVAYRPGFEVVVVNGPSTDGTEAILERWGGRIKVGRCDRPNLSVSRNIGIAMAAGDIVAFMDDDAVAEPEWLEQLAMPFSNEEVAIAGGHTYDHTGVTFQYRYGTIDRLGADADPLQEWDPVRLAYPLTSRFPYPIGTNSAFRRSTLIAIGGFDEEYEYFLDETDVVVRLIDAGWMIRQLPNAYIHHKFAPSSMRGENRVAKHRYSIVKNHVYFGLRNAREHFTTEELEHDQEQFVASERQSVINAIALKLLDDSDLRRYDEDAERALVDGRAHADRADRVLLGADAIERLSTPFLRFEPRGFDPVRRAIVTSASPTTSADRDALREFAYAGWVVHLLEPAGLLHTVDFDDGLWLHRLAAEGRSAAALGWDELMRLEVERLRVDRPVAVVTGLADAQAALRDSAAATSGAHSERHLS
jgi:glycosyltransferase involved in cell wall biosynthesis